MYGVMIYVYLKLLCFYINEIYFVSYCFQVCMVNIDIYYMLSYNREKQVCFCCVDFFGSEIIDLFWNIYEMSKYLFILSILFKSFFLIYFWGGG